jgi:hypothetical protein
MDAAQGLELLKHFQDGDTASFHELVRKYQEKFIGSHIDL